MKNPRIALIGNCQATTLARILHLFAPAAEVVRFPFSDLPDRYPTQKAVFAALSAFDLIFAQPFGPGLHPAVDGLILQEQFGERFYFYPVVEFSAFHPDCIYVRHRKSGEFLRSPMSDYHSAVALAGHSLGFTAGQTLRLFDAEVFARLGYFRFWKPSEDALADQCRAIGFPLARMYRSWVRRGVFMHTINHPRLFVLGDVARALLEASGCRVPSGNAEDYLIDDALYDPVWPLYPEVAEALSLGGGSYLFKSGSRSDRLPLFTLPEFVARSHEMYGEQAPGVLESARVDKWLRDAALVERLRSRAECPASV